MTDSAAETIIRPRRGRAKRHQAHHGGAWKVAYADFVTAMMAFFLLLWLISNVNKSKLKGLADYFTPITTSNNPMGSGTALAGRRLGQAEEVGATAAQPVAGGSANIPDAALRVFADEMLVALQAQADMHRNVQVRPDQNGLRVNLVDTAEHPMFRGPTAELNDYGRHLLTSVARQLIRSNAQLAIEGHTDAVGGNSDTNWRLSGERALAARAAMIAAGMPPYRFSEVIAKAGTEPIYPSQPERPENRRITIVALAEPPALPRDASFRF
ncbi:flagellar motor protein MotB [Sphingomonas endophytica]|uniref:Chemotaxis protein MotB n=1 Tax=Sphingomonas endophytica TaxID=869719 RepID=A0A7X0MNN9_9SPHN|nr:flagellar motor protein MotB [Sphingomonas endophytica]MBB5725672.1 chemotaxis protein MotB [Sphingomonas endophytica]MBB6505366.1 chemotaxis protein MotB [Sphingomonas endophytica]